MASSDIAWICGQCTNKSEGSSEPGPCHFCQTPHPQRKAVVVSVPTSAPVLPNAAVLLAVASALPTKPACICQPACSSGYVIDLPAPYAAQAVASVLPAKAVIIHQPAPCSSGSFINLSTPDGAQAVASTLPAKPVSIRQPASCSYGSVIDLSAPDVALAAASMSPAKPVFGLSSSIEIDIARIDAVEEYCVLTDQNLALAIVVGQLKSREQEAA